MSTPTKPVSILYDGDGEPTNSSSWWTSEWPVETGIPIECLIPHLLRSQSPPPSKASVTQPQTALKSPSHGDVVLNEPPTENNGLTNMSAATSCSLPNNTLQDSPVGSAISKEQVNQQIVYSSIFDTMKKYLLDVLFGSGEVEDESLNSVLLSTAFLPERAGEEVAETAADSHDADAFHFEFDNDNVQRQEMSLASPESQYRTSTPDSAVRAAADSHYNDVMGFEYDDDFVQQEVLLANSGSQCGSSTSAVRAEADSQYNEVFDFEYDDDFVQQKVLLETSESQCGASTSVVRAEADSQYNEVFKFEYDDDFVQQEMLLATSDSQYGASTSVVRAEADSQYNEVVDFEYDDDFVQQREISLASPESQHRRYAQEYSNHSMSSDLTMNFEALRKAKSPKRQPSTNNNNNDNEDLYQPRSS